MFAQQINGATRDLPTALPCELFRESGVDMHAVSEKGWQKNPQARLCRLYLVGKSKSLLKQKWL